MCGGGSGDAAQRHGVGPGAAVSERRVASSVVTPKVSEHPRRFKRQKSKKKFQMKLKKLPGSHKITPRASLA